VNQFNNEPDGHDPKSVLAVTQNHDAIFDDQFAHPVKLILDARLWDVIPLLRSGESWVSDKRMLKHLCRIVDHTEVTAAKLPQASSTTSMAHFEPRWRSPFAHNHSALTIGAAARFELPSSNPEPDTRQLIFLGPRSSCSRRPTSRRSSKFSRPAFFCRSLFLGTASG